MTERSPSPLSWRTDLWVWFGLLVLGLLAFGPSLGGARLWDDPAHLTRADLQGLDGLWRIWFDLGATQQYYPVLHSAFWWEHQLWGQQEWPYHLVNIVWHSLAGALLVRWVRGYRRGPSGLMVGGVAGALFVVHPVAVESVAWITEQKNTLSLALALGAAVGWRRFLRTRSAWAYAGATGLFLLALGTKSVTATLPPALLVVEWWQRGRLRVREVVLPLLPWLVLGVAAGLFTAWVERTFIGAQGEAFALTLGERTLLAARALVFYACTWVWPTELAFFYRLWDVPREAPGWWPYLAGLLILIAGLGWWARRQRGPLATVLLYAGILFPALGFVNVFPFQFSYVADHFQYHATPVLAAAVALGLGRWVEWGRKQYPWIGYAVGGLVAVLLASGVILARGYSAQYLNNETLFRANLAVVPDNWMAHRILAVTLSRDPARLAEAETHFREALRLRPESPDVQMGLAEVIARRPEGRAEAIELYRQAVRGRPHFVEARYNLALLLTGRPESAVEARENFEEVIRLAPTLHAARLELAFLLLRTPAWRFEAEGVLKELLALQPGHGDAHYALANLYMNRPAQRDEALGHYAAAVAAGVERPELFFDFGQALARDPAQWREAVKQLQRGLQLKPTDADAHNAIGVLFAQAGDLDTARQWWEAALRVNPRHAPSRQNLQRLGVLP